MIHDVRIACDVRVSIPNEDDVLPFLPVEEVRDVVSRRVLKHQACDVQHVRCKLCNLYGIYGLLRKFCEYDCSFKPYWVRYSQQLARRRREPTSPFCLCGGASR